MNDVTRLIKQAAMEAMESSSPVKLVFGEVMSISPLIIKVDQKLSLTAAQLILTKNVVDYDLDMTVNHFTEATAGGSGYSLFESHVHAYTGRKTFRVHNALIVGDQVIMLQMQGGEKYIVIEKVVKP